VVRDQGRATAGEGRARRPAGPRLRLAVMALVAVLITGPGALSAPDAQAASQQGGGNLPVANGIPENLGKVVEVTGSLSIYRPGGKSFHTLGSPTQQLPSLPPNAQKGQPCDVLNVVPVSFTDILPNWINIVGGWLLFNDAWLETGLNAEGSIRAATSDAWAKEVAHGEWWPGPNGLYCETNPGIINATVTYSYPCPPYDTFNCLWWVDHPIWPANSPVNWAPYVADASGLLKGQAGSISAAPTAKTTVGQFPTCFWIDGVGVPVERDLAVVIAGAPDASGRSIFYTLLMKLIFKGVDWNFDDASGDNGKLPNAESICGVHPFVTAHYYKQLSEGKPGNSSHVTATETYQIEADLYWYDSGGPEQRSVTGEIPPQVITPNSHSVMVGQIEGVPTS
jgi:hypothetical protein